MIDYDTRPTFEKLCRQRGTRINAIMTRLERGEDIADIARRYHTDRCTIRVYRKALEGKLSTGSERTTAGEAKTQVDRLWRTVGVMREAGQKLPVIAAALDISYETARTCMARWRYYATKENEAQAAPARKKARGKSGGGSGGRRMAGGHRQMD